MKKVMFALALAALAAAPVSAQTTSKLLFPATPITDSNDINLPGVNANTVLGLPKFEIDPASLAPNAYENAKPFAVTTVWLWCPSGGTVSLSGDDGITAPPPYSLHNSLVVDNFIKVTNNQDASEQVISANGVIPPTLFNGVNGVYPAAALAQSNLLGHGVVEAYGAVPDQSLINITSDTNSSYTFQLMDWGYVHANSNVYLKTGGSCQIVDKLCHYDQGKRVWKEMTLDPDGIAAHLRVHDDVHNAPGPADYIGKCSPSNPPGKR
jgi:hypothetical protein